MNKSQNIISTINSILSLQEEIPAEQNALHQKLTDETHSRNLSDAQKFAVKNYSGTDYMDVNKHLRGITHPFDHPDSTVERARKETKINQVASVTNHPTAHSFHAYRGFRGRNPDEFEKGQEFHDKGFTSTSIDKDHALFHAGSVTGKGTMFKIHVHAGTKGAYITPHSEFPEEREFVLHKGTKFHVGDHETDENGDHLVNLHIHSQED